MKKEILFFCRSNTAQGTFTQDRWSNRHETHRICCFNFHILYSVYNEWDMQWKRSEHHYPWIGNLFFLKKKCSESVRLLWLCHIQLIYILQFSIISFVHFFRFFFSIHSRVSPDSLDVCGFPGHTNTMDFPLLMAITHARTHNVY